MTDRCYLLTRCLRLEARLFAAEQRLVAIRAVRRLADRRYRERRKARGS
jgi:hypothetical protein